MRLLVATAGTLALTAASAFAGGLDRSGQSIGVIFEKGNYAEFSLGAVSPTVEGVGAGAALSALTPTPGQASGDMTRNYVTFAGAYKHQFPNGLSAAIIFDAPFGANVEYPAGSTYYARGSTAELKTTALTGVLKYTLPSNFSAFGGLRYQTLSAVASVPFIPGGGYTANGSKDAGIGYLVGVAFEKPEIALRVALTYNSKVKHELPTVDASVFTGQLPVNSITTLETPQSVSLEFQSGVAKDTLLFGSVRWVEWSKFALDPLNYPPTTPIVSYDSNTVSYTLGVGRKFSDTWSGAVTLGYESQTGGFASNLGPTDGYWSIGLGGTYTRNNMKVTGGIRYVAIGDADTTLSAPSGVAAGNFRGNTALAAGIKVGFTF